MKNIFKVLLLISFSSHSAEVAQNHTYIYDNYLSSISKSTELVIADKTNKLVAQYDEYFSLGKEDCNAENNADLHARFTAANMLAGYTMFSHFEKNDAYIEDMEVCLSKLISTGTATDKDFNALFGAYISSRKFLIARSFAARHPQIRFPYIPTIRTAPTFVESHQSILSLTQDNNFVAESIQLSPKSQIIIVAGCHFALDALRFIESNDKIKIAFRNANAIWLIPDDRELDIAGLREIRENFPDTTAILAYRNSAWPGIDFSISPNFYFYKNGELVNNFEGWSKNGVPEEVVDILKEMNLLQ